MSRDRRKTANVTPISVAEARLHVAAARQYLDAAETAHQEGNLHAAGGNAVLAGVHAGDAVAGFLQGTRWSGAHEQAARHVKAAGREGVEVGRELRRLLPEKTRYHYDAAAPSKTKTDTMVAAARRAVAVAERVAARHARDRQP